MSTLEAEAPVKEKREEPIKKIILGDFKMSEYAYTRFSVTLPVDWKPDEVLKPEFWVNVAHLLQKDPRSGTPAKTGSIIEIRSEDHSFYGELYVRAVRERALDVKWVKPPVFFNAETREDDKYKVRWNVGSQSYEIMRITDKQIVGKGYLIKEEAIAEIEKMKA